MISYHSTRDRKAEHRLTASQAILKGLADDGGLFVVDKRHLTGKGGTVTADLHFSKASSPAISGNIVLQLALTEEFCVATTDNGTEIIDLDSLQVSPLRLPDGQEIRTLVGNGSEVWTERYYREETPSIIPTISDFLEWLDALELAPLYKEKWLAL